MSSVPNYYRGLDAPTDSNAETSRECLARVRRSTCYRTWRAVVALSVAPFYLLGIFIALSPFLEIAFRIPKSPHPEWLIVGGGSVVFLTLAIHQAARVLTDIADLQVDQARKQRTQLNAASIEKRTS